MLSPNVAIMKQRLENGDRHLRESRARVDELELELGDGALETQVRIRDLEAELAGARTANTVMRNRIRDLERKPHTRSLKRGRPSSPRYRASSRSSSESRSRSRSPIFTTHTPPPSPATTQIPPN